MFVSMENSYVLCGSSMCRFPFSLKPLLKGTEKFFFSHRVRVCIVGEASRCGASLLRGNPPLLAVDDSEIMRW